MKSIHPMPACLLIPGMPFLPTSDLPLARLFQEGESIPGSTTGILLMGILIVIIILIPIVWTRRKWMR